MKTTEEFLTQLDNIAYSNGNLKNKDILDAIMDFEKEIRQDQKEEDVDIFSKSGFTLRTKEIFDDPIYCNSNSESCRYILIGHCMLRPVDPKEETIDKFLTLERGAGKSKFCLKTSTCKFLWEKENKK